jgi:hypothetical protein
MNRTKRIATKTDGIIKYISFVQSYSKFCVSKIILSDQGAWKIKKGVLSPQSS